MTRHKKALKPLYDLIREFKRSRNLGTEENAKLDGLLKDLGHCLATNDNRKATQKVIDLCEIFLRD